MEEVKMKKEEMKIGICGIGGRMGKEVARISSEKGMKITLGIERKEIKGDIREILRKELGFLPEHIIFSPEELSSLPSPPDVIIDFSHRGVIIPYIRKVVEENMSTGFVIGTTGFSEEELSEIENLSQKVPIFMASNMSRGINFLLKFLPEVRSALYDFDVEIVEVHHGKKKDAPSGTALRLAEVLKKGEELVFGRKGMVGERRKNEIGVFAVRGGDVIGDHTIFFLGDGERIEITHRATSRRVFAVGAVEASKIIFEKLKKGEKGLITSFF